MACDVSPVAMFKSVFLNLAVSDQLMSVLRFPHKKTIWDVDDFGDDKDILEDGELGKIPFTFRCKFCVLVSTDPRVVAKKHRPIGCNRYLYIFLSSSGTYTSFL